MDHDSTGFPLEFVFLRLRDNADPIWNSCQTIRIEIFPRSWNADQFSVRAAGPNLSRVGLLLVDARTIHPGSRRGKYIFGNATSDFVCSTDKTG